MALANLLKQQAFYKFYLNPKQNNKKHAIGSFLIFLRGAVTTLLLFMTVSVAIRPNLPYLCPLERASGTHKNKGNPPAPKLGNPAS